MAKARVTAKQREKIRDQARGCCEYCLSQEAFSPDAFSVEHVIPRVKGGTNAGKNLAFSCQGCNNRKYLSTDARDPITGETVALFHPRNHTWAEHFAWNATATLVIGLTPTGRATVEKLALNRAAVANLRRVLASQRLHPPSA